MSDIKKNTTPTLVAVFTSGSALQDVSSGKFSYIDVFDAITIPKSLGFYYYGVFVGIKILNVSKGHDRTKVELVDPDGEILATSAAEGDVNDGNVQITIQLPLVKFEKPGAHVIRIWHNDKKLSDDNLHYLTVLAEA